MQREGSRPKSTTKKIIKLHKGDKSDNDQAMRGSDMRKYLITTIKNNRDGSKYVVTRFKPEVP